VRIVLTTMCLSLVCGLTYAQTSIDGQEVEETFAKVREFMELEREVTIEGELMLTEAEANGFWPIYENYRGEIETYQDRYSKLLRDFADSFGDLTDTAATEMIDDYFAIRMGTLEVRQRYVAAFLDVMPARKLVRFYQMENKIDAVAELPLILDIPLLEVSASDNRDRR